MLRLTRRNATMGITNGIFVRCIGPSSSRGRGLGTSAAITLSVVLLGACLISAPTNAQAEEPGHVRAPGYPAVEDVPPRPEKPAMTTDEQLKLKKDLAAARDRQAPKGKSSGTGAARAEPVKP
jgi:hypothetical protein